MWNLRKRFILWFKTSSVSYTSDPCYTYKHGRKIRERWHNSMESYCRQWWSLQTLVPSYSACFVEPVITDRHASAKTRHLPLYTMDSTSKVRPISKRCKLLTVRHCRDNLRFSSSVPVTVHFVSLCNSSFLHPAPVVVDFTAFSHYIYKIYNSPPPFFFTQCMSLLCTSTCSLDHRRLFFKWKSRIDFFYIYYF